MELYLGESEKIVMDAEDTWTAVHETGSRQ